MPDDATVRELIGMYPFLESMPGLTNDIIIWIEEGYSDAEVVARMRVHNEYTARFPAMFDPSGQMRFPSEAAYIEEERQLADVMSLYGDPTYRYDDPSDFSVLISRNINPQQLNSRFEVYTALEQSSADIRSAFYVYAGLDLTTDDLYSAVVNPTEMNRLWDEYTTRSATANLDLDTYIGRLAEFGTKEATIQIDKLRQEGLITDRQYSQFVANASDLALRTANRFVQKQFDPNDDTPELMSVQESQQALQYALIGSAATAYSFDLEDDETIQMFIERGVTRASALSAYGQLASQGARFQSMVDRGGTVGEGFSTLQAVMQGQSGEVVDQASRSRLASAMRAEDATMNARGSAPIQSSRSGQLQQEGLRVT